MAARDVFNQGVTAVAQNAYFSMQPSAGVEVIIHNINQSSDAVLEFYDGTTAIATDTKTGGGAWMGMFLHCTNSKYYRVKNINASPNNIACDGVQTK